MLVVVCECFFDDVFRIGGWFSNVLMLKGILRGLKVEGEDLIVVGVVVSWSGKDVYYVFFKEYIYLLLS